MSCLIYFDWFCRFLFLLQGLRIHIIFLSLHWLMNVSNAMDWKLLRH